MIQKRFMSFVILWTIVIFLAMSKNEIASFLFISAIGLIAQNEFYQLQKHKGFKVFRKAGLLCGALLFLFSYVYLRWELGPHNILTGLEPVILLVAIIGGVSRQIFEYEKDQRHPVDSIALTMFGFFYVPYLFHFMLKILLWEKHSAIGFYFAVYLVAVTKLTDVGAYLIGKWLGRHPMAPKISPKKTWEGFVGGLVVAMLTSWISVLIFPRQLGVIKYAPLLGIFIGLGSVLGDLGESIVKRDAQSKDSGDMIPGIGGALDLIDSLLFTAPFFYCYLVLVVS